MRWIFVVLVAASAAHAEPAVALSAPAQTVATGSPSHVTLTARSHGPHELRVVGIEYVAGKRAPLTIDAITVRSTTFGPSDPIALPDGTSELTVSFTSPKTPDLARYRFHVRGTADRHPISVDVVVTRAHTRRAP